MLKKFCFKIIQKRVKYEHLKIFFQNLNKNFIKIHRF